MFLSTVSLSFSSVLDFRGRLGGKVESACKEFKDSESVILMFLRVLVPAYLIVLDKRPLKGCFVDTYLIFCQSITKNVHKFTHKTVKFKYYELLCMLDFYVQLFKYRLLVKMLCSVLFWKT